MKNKRTDPLINLAKSIAQEMSIQLLHRYPKPVTVVEALSVATPLAVEYMTKNPQRWEETGFDRDILAWEIAGQFAVLLASENMARNIWIEEIWLAGADEGRPTHHLLCLGCREKVRGENEPNKIVLGLTKHSDVRCSLCKDKLSTEDSIAAVTFYDSEQDYEPWEQNYLVTQ